MPYATRKLCVVLVLIIPGHLMGMDQASVEADCRRAAQLDGISKAERSDYMAACLSQHQATYGTPVDPAADGGTADPESDETTRGRTKGSTAAPASYGPNWRERIGDMDAPPEHRDW